jgi:AcrR family transcriptional regulator
MDWRTHVSRRNHRWHSRRRGTTLERAIVDTAWEELVAVGYDRVTMAGIATRARTNEATLYRRWQNRTELLATAIDRRVVCLDTRPIDTGNLRDDVLAVLRSIRRRCDAAAVVPDPSRELAADVRRQAAAEVIQQIALVLRTVAGREELDTQALSAQISRLPVTSHYSELSLTDQPVTDQLLVDIVDDQFLPRQSTSPCRVSLSRPNHRSPV